jgi:L-ascorbate oxidase
MQATPTIPMPSLTTAAPSTRLQANNPGVWPFHCHISWHSQIGQMLYFLEDPEKAPAPPADMPACKRNCTYNFAPWTPTYTKKRYGGSGYELP